MVRKQKIDVGPGDGRDQTRRPLDSRRETFIHQGAGTADSPVTGLPCGHSQLAPMIDSELGGCRVGISGDQVDGGPRGRLGGNIERCMKGLGSIQALRQVFIGDFLTLKGIVDLGQQVPEDILLTRIHQSPAELRPDTRVENVDRLSVPFRQHRTLSSPGEQLVQRRHRTQDRRFVPGQKS